MRFCMAWNTTKGLPIRIETTIFDDRYANFSEKEDFILPFVPDFLLLHQWVCQVAVTHNTWTVIRKELIESLMEKGRWITEFKEGHLKEKQRGTQCGLTSDQKEHIKLKMASAFKPVFERCLEKCIGFLHGGPEILHYLRQPLGD